jgi:HPt (histidine-containing phosphotransfer) domain-containing protein
LQLPIPIIAMTAHSLVGEQERCYDAGMDAYVPKPFKQAVLLEAIRTVMNKDLNTVKKRRIDFSYVDEMACGNPEFKKEMILLFIEKIPAEVTQLEAAFKDNDAERVRKMAHNMKSSLDMFMLTDLSNCLAIIEEEAILGAFTSQAADQMNILNCGISEVVKIINEL